MKPRPTIRPTSPIWEGEVLTAIMPGKSLNIVSKMMFLHLLKSSLVLGNFPGGLNLSAMPETKV